jgi:hypothetical protein
VQRVSYELWDQESGNCVGAFPSRTEALQAVLELVKQYGASRPEVAQLGLVESPDDNDKDGTLVAAGQGLVQLARTVSTPVHSGQRSR